MILSVIVIFDAAIVVVLVFWKYWQIRNQVTLREVGELRFFFLFSCWQSQVSSYSKFWAPTVKPQDS
jgi:hypothetical protein